MATTAQENYLNEYKYEFEQEDIYDIVLIEDLDFHEGYLKFYYPCPCGDKFVISLQEILKGRDTAVCSSCSLQIKVIFDLKFVKENYKEFLN